MRYLFCLIIVAVVWFTTILIATSTTLKTADRFALYVCLVVLTFFIYNIGFSKK